MVGFSGGLFHGRILCEAAAHGCSWGFVNPKFGQDEYYVPGLVGSTHADAEHHRCTAPGMPHDNNKATAKACL